MSWLSRFLDRFFRRPPQPPPLVPPIAGETLTDRWDDQMLELHNNARRDRGLRPLVQDKRLDEWADEHSESMMRRGVLSHSNYNAWENIAGWSASPDSTFDQWMNSSGHRANILNPSLSKVGFGVAADSRGRHWWTTIFTR